MQSLPVMQMQPLKLNELFAGLQKVLKRIPHEYIGIPFTGQDSLRPSPAINAAVNSRLDCLERVNMSHLQFQE